MCLFQRSCGPVQAECTHRHTQGRPHRGGAHASTSTGTDGHRQGHGLSHSQRKQIHVSRDAGTQGVRQPHTQRYKHRGIHREEHGSGGQTGTLTETPRDTGTWAHTGMDTNTRRCPAPAHTGQDTNAGTSHTPAQHSLVLRKGDPDTHSEQKHSRAQTHSAFRHSHTL